MNNGLTGPQKEEYATNGYVALPGVFDRGRCDQIVARMMALQQGSEVLDGFAARDADNWGRTFNQHLYDPVAMELMLAPELEQVLTDCMDDTPEGVQTMYFYKGSEQKRHQDQYYLPGCMSAWVPMIDVGPDNGTIWVQPGSHKGHLVTAEEMREKYGHDEPLSTFDERYDMTVNEAYDRNKAELGLGDDVPVVASAGDVVLFHGYLIHRGGPVASEDAYRHVMASHYLPYHFEQWPYSTWARFNFEGLKRFAYTDDSGSYRWK